MGNDFAHAVHFETDFAHALYGHHESFLDRARDRASDRDRGSARAGARALVLALAVAYYHAVTRASERLPGGWFYWLRWRWLLWTQGIMEVNALKYPLNRCLNAFKDLVLLEERIKGNVPAWEGIRIVRKRVEVYFPEPQEFEFVYSEEDAGGGGEN